MYVNSLTPRAQLYHKSLVYNLLQVLFIIHKQVVNKKPYVQKAYGL